MKFYEYVEQHDSWSAKRVIVSEKDIIDEYWDYWYSRMIEKFGKIHVDENYGMQDCIDDFCIVHWAVEIKENIMNNYSLTEQEIAALQSVQQKLHGQAKAMGWHNTPRDSGTLIALMHSELSEALEGLRKDQMDDHLQHRKMVEVELADCIIRILDAAGAWNLDVAGAIAEKHDYNARREDHKLENRAKEGGKKF